MLMELPGDKFVMKGVAYTEGRNLIITQIGKFEKLMSQLAYALRKTRCVYCGRRLKGKDRTLDHRYPRALGGVSIVDNLYPCCLEHNSKKGEFTHEEYKHYMSLKNSKKHQEIFKREVEKQHERAFEKKGFVLPKNWIDYIQIDKIYVSSHISIIRGAKYERLENFFKKYGKLNKPIIIDNNFSLLSGVTQWQFCIDNGIKKVPVIHLENVFLLES